MLSIDGNVCNTDDVINNIQTSTQIQEQKITSLEKLEIDCQSFIEDVMMIDYEVSDLINQIKYEFYEYIDRGLEALKKVPGELPNTNNGMQIVTDNSGLKWNIFIRNHEVITLYPSN